MRTLGASVCRCPSASHGRAQPIDNQDASMMALQKSPGGVWAALAAPGLILHFKISKKQKALSVRKRFWFPPAVVQGLRRAVAVGFSFLGIPVCLTPVFSPRVWTLRCMAVRWSPTWRPLSRSLALSPSGVLCGIHRATSLRTDGYLLYPAAARGALRLSSRACSRARAASPIAWCPSLLVCCDALNYHIRE
jgi:hypothetical protein